MMTPQQAREFADRWLRAWTGNNPEKLAAFYSKTHSIWPRAALMVCKAKKIFLIRRNEVYFDRTNLFLEILKHRANKQE